MQCNAPNTVLVPNLEVHCTLFSKSKLKEAALKLIRDVTIAVGCYFVDIMHTYFFKLQIHSVKQFVHEK